MPIIDFSSESMLIDLGRHNVYSRLTWGGNAANPWVETPYLHCLEQSHVAAPSLNAAQFLWKHGEMVQPETSVFAEYAWSDGPNSAKREFIKVIQQTRFVNGSWNTMEWHGVVEIEDLIQGGLRTGNPDVEMGDSTFSCYGLEKILADRDWETP